MLNIELSLQLKKGLLSILENKPNISFEQLFLELFHKVYQENNVPFSIEEVEQGLQHLYIDGEIKTIPEFKINNPNVTKSCSCGILKSLKHLFVCEARDFQKESDHNSMRHGLWL